MFIKEDIYEYPLLFSWRYTKNTDEGIYQKLNICVSNFQGHGQWIMYKGSGNNDESKRNYTIEPEFFRKIYKQHGYKKLPEILESDFKEDLQKALEDVVPLAKYIEKEFGVQDVEPIPITYPWDEI